MKALFIFLVSIAASASAFAEPIHFVCTGSKEVRWTTYYCAYGTLSNDGRAIADLIFGTCEGSRRAGEEEPVDVYDFKIVNHNPALAASSAQWKNAGAFDVTTPGLGPAVFYYAGGSPVARLKVNGKDIRLDCAN